MLPRSAFCGGANHGAPDVDGVKHGEFERTHALPRSDRSASILARSLGATPAPRSSGGSGGNGYLTPPSARGFAPHYDTHDVLVLQVEGYKHWKVYESPLPWPTPRQPYGQHLEAMQQLLAERTPLIDTVLSPGDTLFIPRGCVHWAETDGMTSLHVTLGLHAQTRVDLVRAALVDLENRLERDGNWLGSVSTSCESAPELERRLNTFLACLSLAGAHAMLDRERWEFARATATEQVLL